MKIYGDSWRVPKSQKDKHIDERGAIGFWRGSLGVLCIVKLYLTAVIK